VSDVKSRERREVHTYCYYVSCRLKIKYYKRMCTCTYTIMEIITITTIIITITVITVIIITTKTILLLPLIIQ
jgi:hypothetical protein